MGNGEVTFRIGERRSGKSTAILEWLKKNPDGIVVSATAAMADQLRRRAISEGMSVRKEQFVSHGRPLHGFKGAVAIDEGQFILQMLYPNLDFVTATGELDG